MTQTAPFSLLFRVRYGECDAQQVVFNARYADYVDLASTEFMRAIGLDYKGFLARGLDTQVVSMTLNWSSPARFDDVLRARVATLRLGTTSLTLGVDFSAEQDGREIASAEVVYVMISTGTWQKTAIPDDVRALYETGAPGVEVDQAQVAGGAT